MAGLFSAPKPVPVQQVAPAPVPVPTPVPTPAITPPDASSAEALKAEADRVAKERQKYSQQANILTGQQGDTSIANIGKKVLLGE